MLVRIYDAAMFQLHQITLNGRTCPRLSDVTLTICSGRTAIVGYSGAGKTSLLNVLAGFEQANAGTVRTVLKGDPAETASRKARLPLYWVPQNGGLWPHLTVDQHLSCVGSAESSDKLLRSLDLEHRRSALPAELSLGERSRLALARALATRAEVLLLDEPLGHVDPVRKPAYWNVIREMIGTVSTSPEQREASIVFTSHEPETVLRHSENVICLREGRVVFQGTTASLYDSPPSREVGEFLGPLNWFDAEEAALFVHDQNPGTGASAIRPERMIMVADSGSSVEFVSMPFRGGYAESIVRHVASGRTRTILHQVSGDVPSTGQHVRLIAGGGR